MSHFKYYIYFVYIMEKEQMIKQLEEDNQLDLEELSSTERDYEKLKQNWLKRDTEIFEIVSQIELRKQIINQLTNNF